MFKDVLHILFPKLCAGCDTILSDNEKIICTKCRHELPVTNFHFNNSEDVKKMLYGRVKLQNGTALFHFSKQSIVQHLLHQLKYKGQESISELLGLWLGEELKTLPSYQSVDVVVPVPLHPKRLNKRGYNQVAKFGLAIAKALSAVYCDSVLIKTKATKTQVFKNRLTRWNADDSQFALKNDTALAGKHILLVDDIITTGATAEACATELFKIDNISLSFATMAIAD